MKKLFFKLSFFILLFLAVTNSLWAQVTSNSFDFKLKIEEDGLPAKPPLSVQKRHTVYDFAKLLSNSERQLLNEKISQYYDSTSTQILVATVNTVNNDIALYAAEWAHKWGIGIAGKDNGVFVLVSKNDHKVTISTGYGTEPLLTDIMSTRIIQSKIIPYFKQGEFYNGLDAGITAIQQVLSGEFVNDLPNDSEDVPVWLIILIILIVIIVLSSIIKAGPGSGGGWHSSGGGPIIFSSGGRSSWGSGGGSFGGGFSGGFGGGGFGGGGATGSW